MPDPAILQVVLALESNGNAGDNIHLFTNQQYQIAVRAVARNGNTIFEDDNDEIVVSYSSGYQGIAHLDIIDWPCLELCDPVDLSDVKITSMPPLAVASLPVINTVITSLPDIEASVTKVPVLTAQISPRR
jgi:hypothetical protein